jgi:hypothetical protein
MYARNILYQDIAPRYAVKKALELEQLTTKSTKNMKNSKECFHNNLCALLRDLRVLRG